MAGQRATRPLPLSWRMFMLSFIKEILHRQQRRVLWCPRPHEAKLLAWESLDPVQKKTNSPTRWTCPLPRCFETLNSVRLSACSAHTHHTLVLGLPETLVVTVPCCAVPSVGVLQWKGFGSWNLSSSYKRLRVNLTRFKFSFVRNNSKLVMFLFFSFRVMSMSAKCRHKISATFMFAVSLACIFYC